MLKRGYYSDWAFKTVGAAIISLIFTFILSSWKTEAEYSNEAKKKAFEAEKVNIKQQQQINRLDSCRQNEQIDRAVLRSKLENIEKQGNKTYDLVLKMWENKR